MDKVPKMKIKYYERYKLKNVVNCFAELGGLIMESMPFIKIFKSIHGYYMFDANKNEIIPISRDSYQFLDSSKIENKLLLGKIPNELEQLIKKGYMAPQQVVEIKHPMTDYVESILERRVKKITLQLTQNCNFRCKYCHYTDNDGVQRLHSKKRMDIETAKKAIMFLRDHSIDVEEVYIGFYGGEPLLEFNMMKELIVFAKNVLEGKKVQFMLSTNSVLMNEEIISYIEQEHINLLISLDGPKEINDVNRVMTDGSGTFDYIIDKIQQIHKHHPKLYKKMMINVVMNPSHDFDKILSLFKEYPFLNKIEVNPNIVDDTGAKEENVFTDLFVSKIRYYDFLVYLSVLNRISREKLPVLMKQRWMKIMESTDDFQKREFVPREFAPGGPCVPGENRLMVTVDGKFIVCERVNEISDCMIIGSLGDGFYFEKIKNLLNIARLTEEQCMKCWAFHGCTICGKKADDHGILSGEMKMNECNNSRTVFMEKLRERALLMEAASVYGQVSIV